MALTPDTQPMPVTKPLSSPTISSPWSFWAWVSTSFTVDPAGTVTVTGPGNGDCTPNSASISGSATARILTSSVTVTSSAAKAAAGSRLRVSTSATSRAKAFFILFFIALSPFSSGRSPPKI